MKKCILIFDDDQEILFVCKVILEKQNYRVETRTRCDNIIEDIREIKPELILMDVRIPEIGGEKAVKLVKDNEDITSIPIILFSANTEIEEICKRSNANGFLPKPFDVTDLLAMVQKKLEVRHQVK